METPGKLNLSLLAKTVALQIKETLRLALDPLIDRVAQLEAERNVISRKEAGDMIRTMRCMVEHTAMKLERKIGEADERSLRQGRWLAEQDMFIKRQAKAIAALQSKPK
jgi:hypothetical protein